MHPPIRGKTSFAPDAIPIAIKVRAIARLTTLYRCSPSRSGSRAIRVIDSARWCWLGRLSSVRSAVAVTPAVLPVVVTAVGSEPARMPFSRCWRE